MRTLFIVLRSSGYLAILLYLIATGKENIWINWIISLIIAGWNSWDHWKKPSETVFHMRLGVVLETLLILLWAIIVKDGVILFMLASPLMRGSIHLSIVDDIALLVMHFISLTILNITIFEGHLSMYLILGSLIGIGLYSTALGLLLKQREQARRQLALTAFEREQSSKDQERIRIAEQLHDVMGQHWASIVRALDVALVTQGEQSMSFIKRARETALEGLQEMRSAVHDWQDGRQTPQQWMDDLHRSVARFQAVSGINILLEIEPLTWSRFENPNVIPELLARSGIEAMTNAVRHGEADQISISLRGTNKAAVMIIKDNGRGLKPDLHTYGSGINSIKKRLKMLNGDLNLSSTSGQGTILQIIIPYFTEGEGSK
ncbi:histidine kinase [Paenibacillus alginolyticus]|uniref:sensor histidine kinase n=1 Tax=Paenibacillus alginolyticus TaxID=59839 RepID=UPI0003FAE338|nr:ATP-binding protein [Paenibacillus alginolyticus]MCY9666492.1 histidine kinase [Paenibacillus alginolyticus]